MPESNNSNNYSFSNTELNNKDIFNNLPIGAFSLRSDGRISSANKAMADMFGYKTKEELIESIMDITSQMYSDPADSEKFKCMLKKNSEVSGLEYNFQRRDKSRFWGTITVQAIRDEKGQIRAYQGFIEDITKQKEASEKLKQLESMLTEKSISNVGSETKEVENHLRKSKATIRKKLDTILESDGNLKTLNLSDIIDSEELQALMEDFYKFSKICSAILDIYGNVLVAVGWQDICTKFHRVHPETAKNCLESDLALASGVPAGTFKAYRCKNNMWDMVSPIEIGGKHLGNIYIGQFFYEEEHVDYDVFRRQAKKYGFNEKEYIAALDKVPRLKQETVDSAMAFYEKLAGIISSLSFSKIKLSRDIALRKQAEKTLQEKNHLLEKIFDSSFDLIALTDLEGNFILVGKSHEVLGHNSDDLIGRNVMDFVHPEDIAHVSKEFSNFLKSGGNRKVEYRYKRINEDYLWFESIGTILKDTKGNPEQILFNTRDITERKKTEKSLRENENKMRSIYRVAPTGIGVVENRMLKDVNPHICEMTGYTQKELIGKDSRILYPSRYEYELVGKEKYSQIRKKGTGQVETLWQKKDGTIINIVLASTPIDIDDYTKGVTFTALDITEIKKAEEALIKSEEKFKNIFRNHSAAKLIIDPENGDIKEANKAASKFYGWSVEELQNMNISQINIITPLEIQKEIEKFKSLKKTQLEFKHKKADGNIVDVEVFSSKVVIGDKNYLHSIIHDVTEKKKADQLLNEQKDLLNAIYSNAPLLMMVIDSKRRLQQVNYFAAKFVGRSAEDMLGLPAGEALQCLYAIDAPKGCGFGEFCQNCVIQNTVFDTLKTGKTHLQIESPYYFKDKNNETVELQFLMSTTPIEIKGEYQVLATLEDITELKRAETEKENLQSQLFQSQKMESVGQLAGGVAHDFNNMLGVILGHAEIVLDDINPEHPFFENLQEIQKAAERSANLTRQLLTFARKQTIAPRIIDLNETVEGMLKMLRRLIGEDIDLAWLPVKKTAQVKIDPSQIDQILANLCVNARDSIENVGNITIETELVSIDKEYCAFNKEAVPGDYVMLAVSDTGCGMNKKTLTHLFEPFFTTKEQGKGTGLGLASVYGAVKQNNGFIKAYSEPGKGTTFKIYLPLELAATSAEDDKTTKTTIARGNETILLVEDEPAILHMAKAILTKLGYSVIFAITPGEALRLAHEHNNKIDLLMTDVVMPEMNGLDLAEKLLSIYPDIKYLFMSGYTANVISSHGILDKTMSFIQKPFSSKDLAEKLREVLEKKNTN